MDQPNTMNALYRGWDRDAVRECKDDHDAASNPIPVSSSFTAINSEQQSQLLTPRSPAAKPTKRTWQSYAQRGARRRRNATVAEYLGLGRSEEPAHLEKYAPLRDGPRSPASKPPRKRSKLSAAVAQGSLQVVGRKSIVSMQKPASEGLRVTKPRSNPAAQCQTSFAEASQPQSDCELEGLLPNALEHPTSSSQDALSASDYNKPATRSHAPSGHRSQDTIRASSVEHYTDDQLFDLINDDGIAGKPDHDHDPESRVAKVNFDEAEEFGDELNDDELLELTSDMIDIGATGAHPWSTPLKLDAGRASDTDRQFPGSSAIATNIGDEKTSSTQRTSKKFVSPVTLTTRLLAATGDIDSREARKPIVRSLFPDAVRDRSPIIGLSSSTLLRTCFRIGEMINQAHQASKSGNQVVFELYARILDSKRDNARQYFTLCDLFHGKPPYIKATYDAMLWRSIQLFEYDSKRLLRQGRICRCTGKMKRDGNEWVMTVLNIWEATWDDIKWVEGIVNH